MVQVKIQQVDRDPKILLPSYATPGSAGLDLRSAIHTILMPGRRDLIPTGLMAEIPVGYEGQIRSRSGLATRFGCIVFNAPGTIDSDYRGEIKVLLFNAGRYPVLIESGMRIAQLVVAPYTKVELVEVDELSSSDRGSGGFGSTGSE